jgi:hypothetical protein
MSGRAHTEDVTSGVVARVTNVTRKGFGFAQVCEQHSDPRFRSGTKVFLSEKRLQDTQAAVGDKLVLTVVPDGRGGFKAIGATKQTSMQWEQWRLNLMLPDTCEDTPHEGIVLGCWGCGAELLDGSYIYRIKQSAVWTSALPTSDAIDVDTGKLSTHCLVD